MGHLPAQEGLGRDQARAKGEDAVTLDDAITEIARNCRKCRQYLVDFNDRSDPIDLRTLLGGE